MRTVRCSGHLSCHLCPLPPPPPAPPRMPPTTHALPAMDTPLGTLCHARPFPRTEFLTRACENITVADGNIYSQSKTTDADTAEQIDFVNPTQYRILINPQSVP